MKTSLILCTKNGGERLRTCLSHIDALDSPEDFEFFIVDNGSTDGVSYGIAQDFAKNCRFSAKALQTFEPGNSAGRNIAIAEATGDLVIFIDDDCYADQDLVKEWQKIFSERDIGFATGMILKYEDDQSNIGCIDTPFEKLTPPSGYVNRGFIQGSNMAFRRACLDQAGPFDPVFGAGARFAGEDWDIALKAGLMGWKGGYFPGPKVWHDHRRQQHEARERAIFYDFGGGAVYAKHAFGKGGALVRSNYFMELRNRRDPKRFLALLLGPFAYFLHRLLRR